jgi:capsular polysaccharide biosynthesis protein
VARNHLSLAQQRARVVRSATAKTVRANEIDVPGASCRTTEPSREVRLEVPAHFDAADARALRQRDVSTVPEQFVLELPGATLQGREGWVFHEGRLVDGIWQEHGWPARSMVPALQLDPPVHLPGTTASLLQPWSPNYYHWTTQVVPRAVRLLEVLGGRVDEVDHWLVPGDAPAYVGQWLDLLGVPAERRRAVDTRRQVFTVDRLLVASVPGRNRWVPESAVDGIRAAVAHLPSGPTGRRLLIQRAADRRRILLNADEVVTALRGRGFEVVDTGGMTVAEEAVLFRAADVVVGVHGAGLTNMVFARPGTTVVELTPRGLVHPTFLKLAVAARVDHRMVPGVEPRLPWPLRFSDIHADLRADVGALLRVLDELPAPAPGAVPAG